LKKTSFATFWHGSAPSGFELACISSFIKPENIVNVYSYDKIEKLPAGVINLDAREIVSINFIDKFKVGNSSSMAHFTDFFRMAMFTKSDHIWFDTDIILLRDFDLTIDRDIIGRETDNKICGAIMRLDPHDPRFIAAFEKVNSFMDKPIKWGDTGPRLLTEMYGQEYVKDAQPQKIFYPVHYDDYYKVFLPEFKIDCEALCTEAYTLHLWNNLVTRTGIWKEIGPPKNSFLYSVFEKFGGNQYFNDFYPDNIMRTMVNNAVFKLSKDDGIKKLSKYVIPSIKATFKQHFL